MPNNVIFSTQTIKEYDSEANESKIFSVCADGSKSNFGIWSKGYLQIDGHSWWCNKNVFELRIKQDPDGLNPVRYGSLRKTNEANGGTSRYEYTHPTEPPSLGQLELILEMYDEETDSTTETFMLRVYRAPVLLLHGFNSSSGTFNALANLLASTQKYPDYGIIKGNYSSKSRSGFAANSDVVMKWIDITLNNYHKDEIAASKVNLIGHSMGGILARLYLQGNYRDDINSLITINTPHSGSEAADLCFGTISVLKFVLSILLGLDHTEPLSANGAVGNMRTVSPEIDFALNGPTLNRFKVPSHTIASVQSAISSPPSLDWSRKPLEILGDLLSFVIPELTGLYGDHNDFVVSVESQRGGLTGPSTMTFPNLFHTAVHKASSEVHNHILNLLDADATVSPLFSRSGFDPTDLTFSESQLIASYSNIQRNEAFLQIISPFDNATFVPGQNMHIQIDADPSISEVLVFLSYSRDSLYAISTNGSIDFSFPIEGDTGTRTMHSIGRTENGDVFFDSVKIYLCPDSLNLTDQISVDYYTKQKINLTNSIVRDYDQILLSAPSINVMPDFAVEPGAEIIMDSRGCP